MARVPKKFKAQLITTGKDGKQVKRNFNNVRADISDDDLGRVGTALKKVLNDEELNSLNLTANSSLALD